MSGHSDTAPEPQAGQLGVARAAGGQLAAHEGGARNGRPAEFTRRLAPEGVRERGVSPGPTHPAERDVRRKWPRFAGEAECLERPVHAVGQRDHLGCAVRHTRPDDPRPGGRREGAQPSKARLEGARVRGRPRERAGDGVDPGLGHGAEELEREMQISRRDPGDVTRRGTQPFDRSPERLPDGVVEQDRDERADVGYRGASRSWSKFWIPWRRPGSGSAASAARRSAMAPARSPLSSFSRPRAASARESSGSGAGAGGVGTDTTAGAGGAACVGAAAAGAVSVGGGTATRAGAARAGAGTSAGAAGDATAAGGAVGDAAGPGLGTATAGAGADAGAAGDLMGTDGAGGAGAITLLTAASISAFSPGSGSSSIARSQSARAWSMSPVNDWAAPRAKSALA